MTRWTNWSASVIQWPTTGTCDMPWARSEVEQRYQRMTAPVIDEVVKRGLSISSSVDHDGWVPASMSEIPYASACREWVKDLALGRRCRQQRVDDESSQAGWHNPDFFTMPHQHRVFYYHQ